MDTIALGNTGRITTRLGFGGSSIMGGLGRRDSLAMLEAAFDAGIRHFDTAPMYGYGEAESCLGDFLRRHPGQCTVTTKYGIPPAPGGPHQRLARAIGRPLLKAFPTLKQRLAKPSAPASSPAAPATPASRNSTSIFTAVEAKASLGRSLAALKTDRIDVWLLHEVTADELRDDDLLRLLEDSVKAGTIGTFGVGSGGDKIPDLLARAPQFCPTLQFEWSVLDDVPSTPGAFRIHHRALTDKFRSLHAALMADPARAQRWSSLTGEDLSNPGILANLMLRAALDQNPASLILFSSKNPHHIQANVDIASQPALTHPAAQLYHLVQAERLSLFPV